MVVWDTIRYELNLPSENTKGLSVILAVMCSRYPLGLKQYLLEAMCIMEYDHAL